MQKTIANIEFYAPSVLRYAMTAVIVWFSVEQFIDPVTWTAYVPSSAVAITHLSAISLVYVNATIEAVLGLMLAFGWQTRIVALLLALHLFDIMYVVGYGEIGVRDFGLAFATLVVSMNGHDPLSLSGSSKADAHYSKQSLSTSSKNAPAAPTYHGTNKKRIS